MAAAGKTPLRVVKAADLVYQLRIELLGVEPKIWRRLLVPATMKLHRLHVALLWTMGWSGGHLHEFVIGHDHYGEPDPNYDSPPRLLPDNRVTLDGDGNVVLAYTPTNVEAQHRLYAKLKSLLGHLGMHEHLLSRFAYMKNAIPIAGCAHQAGTCRFGTDPASSVLDVNCKAHELDNLYVVDTSVFPSIGAVNPALTAMANSLRVGDHLLVRLGAEATVAAVVRA